MDAWPARWAWLEVNVADAESFEDVVGSIAEAISAAIDEQADGRLLACRLSLVGETTLDGELRSRQTDLRAEAVAVTLRHGDAEAWIEKVRVATTSPMSADEMAQRADLLGEVLESIPDALNDESFAEQLKEALVAFKSALPHEVQAKCDDPLLRAVIDGDHATLLNSIRGEIAALLTERGS